MDLDDLKKLRRRPDETVPEALERLLGIPEANGKILVREAARREKLTAHGMKPPSAEDREKLATAQEDTGGRRGSSGRVTAHGMRPPSAADRKSASE